MRYIVGVLISVGLIIVIIVLILSGGGGNSRRNQLAPIDVTTLAASGDSVRLVTEGTISADSTYREIQITIGQSTSELDVIGGYNGNIISSHQIGNNQSAYSQFLHALALAGFSNGDLAASQDERGHCALGYRYLYEVVGASGKIRQKLWNDTCGAGTLKGQGPLIRQLFQLQLPDYNKWTNSVNLSGQASSS